MFNSNSPNTIFIDDEFDEIKPLLEVFSKEGISYLYYNGKTESLPQTPYKGVRIVISDINLLKGETQNSENQLINLTTILSKILFENSCAFHLILWTQSENDIVTDIDKYLQEVNLFPINITYIQKPTSFDMKNMKLIEFKELLEKNITPIDSYNFLTDWENTVRNEVSNFTDSLSSIIKNNDTSISWDESAKKIFSCLANSYLGKDIDPASTNENLDALRNYLNQSFIHTISNSSYLVNDMELPKEFDISLQTLSKLNYNLFFNRNFSSRIENGKLFTLNNENEKHIELKNLIINNIFADATLPDTYNPILVGLIITPQCDLAYPRYLHSETSNYQRVLYGIKLNINEEFSKYLKKNQIIKEKQKKIQDNPNFSDSEKKFICKLIKSPFSQDIFPIQPFEDNEKKISVILFHYGSISTEKIENLDLKIIMMLKQDIVFDIQSKLANHVNRLGNSMLEFY